jgi:hypothetical protein
MKSETLDVSVTAISCLKTFSGVVLVGLGNRLELYQSGDLKSSKTVFNSTSASIHGFVESHFSNEEETKVLVFGAKHVAILRLSSPEFLFNCESLEVECEDWIFAAKWISEAEILVLTAHNRVLRLTLRHSELCVSSDVVQCEEKCILYSGQIVDDQNSDMEATVLAGTVFRELIIW